MILDVAPLDVREWKALLHHFSDPFPTVEHDEPVVPAPCPNGWSRERG